MTDLAGHACLADAIGHSYRDLQEAVGELDTGWGRKLLNTLWPNAGDAEWRQVAVLDLLFETEKRERLYGFFAVSHRLRPRSARARSLKAYFLLLAKLHEDGVTVGSHGVFKQGLPACDGSLVETEGELRDMGSVDSENYLFAKVRLGTRRATGSSWEHVLEYSETSLAHHVDADSFRRLKSRSEGMPITQAWGRFAQGLEDTYPSPPAAGAVVNLFAVPIVTRPHNGEAATGALFLGMFEEAPEGDSRRRRMK